MARQKLHADIAAWYNDRGAVERLRDLLNDPTLQRAFRLLLDLQTRDCCVVTPDHNLNSVRLAALTGMQAFRNGLTKLTTYPDKNSSAATPLEWDYLRQVKNPTESDL